MIINDEFLPFNQFSIIYRYNSLDSKRRNKGIDFTMICYIYLYI